MYLKTILVFTLATIYTTKSWPGYQVVTERTEIPYNNLTYVKVEMKTGKINRSAIATNASIQLFQTLPKLAVVTVIGYEYKSNEYRRSSVHISRYVCDYFNKEYKMMFKRIIDKLGNGPKSCPIEKGHYYWTNFIMEPIYIPFKPIGDRWMFEGNLTYDNFTLTSILWYINIVRNSEFYRQN